jgi:polyisoprenoid-binding protein YceI
MKRLGLNLLTLALLFSLLPSIAFAIEWQIDPAHTNVQFSVRHMMISNVRGDFNKVSGTVTSDGQNPDALKIDAVIDAGSIDTRIEKRDQHLKSADFLNVEKYPTIEFKSKKVGANGTGKWKVTGDLTLHGVTKEVVLDVEGPTAEIKDPIGNTRVGASATTKINRKDFGLTWNKVLETGAVMVGDEVEITIDVEAVQKQS